MQEDEHKTNGGREPGGRRDLKCALKTDHVEIKKNKRGEKSGNGTRKRKISRDPVVHSVSSPSGPQSPQDFRGDLFREQSIMLPQKLD